jgi:chaperonin GroEL
MTTIIQDTQDELREGLNIAADIITSSMGQGGSTVIISNPKGLNITKDGVSIARSIQLPNPIHNVGAQLLISAANETVKTCSDGTSLTSLLLQQMVNATKTMEDYRNLEAETKLLKEYIIQQTKKVTTLDQVKQIAMTATNDEYVADLFHQIYTKTSFDTHIELEKTEEKETTITVDKGYRFDAGFNSNLEITDPHKQLTYYENPAFYLTTKPLHTVSLEIQDLVESAMVNDVPLVFVADKYSKEFRRFIHLQITGGAKLLLLDLPSFGEGKQNELDNIKAYLSEEQTALSITSTPYHTIITNDDQPFLQDRLTQIKSLSESIDDELEAKQYLSYYHKLSGNIATIWVGGKTKESRNELYDRIEDAVGATKTAIKHGYVIGAGKCMENFVYPNSTKFHQIWRTPYCKIIENSGVNVNQKAKYKGNEGVNLLTGEPIDLFKSGIIDPAHTLHTALDNALTNTKLVLNTKYILHNE